MNCTVEGYPVESVEWLHDGVPVLTAQDTRIRLLAPLVLVIGSVGRRDKGMYQCLVRSDKENAQATAELKLGGESAIASSVSLSLSFLPSFQRLAASRLLNSRPCPSVSQHLLDSRVFPPGDISHNLNLKFSPRALEETRCVSLHGGTSF